MISQQQLYEASSPAAFGASKGRKIEWAGVRIVCIRALAVIYGREGCVGWGEGGRGGGREKGREVDGVLQALQR